jgi:hypothetical protein
MKNTSLLLAVSAVFFSARVRSVVAEVTLQVQGFGGSGTMEAPIAGYLRNAFASSFKVVRWIVFQRTETDSLSGSLSDAPPMRSS